MAQKLDWHLSISYPTDIREAALEMDSILWDLLQHATKLHIPRVDEGLGVECVLHVPGIVSLQGRSFQHWLVQQPVKQGGLGLCSLVETSPAAFIGGVEMSLPHFIGEEGICPLLQEQVGRVEGVNRWGTFLEAGSRTSSKFNQAWWSFRLEAKQCCTFLLKELEGELAARTAAAGQGKVDGSTRRLVVQQSLHSGLVHDCEVYGLFADLIPAQVVVQGEDLEWGRARQGLVPDFRLRLPSPEGLTDHLAELMFIGAGVTWFPRGVAGKGTDRRASGVPKLYRNKLEPLDRAFHGTAVGQTGPLVQMLEGFGKLEGLVVGPWGKGNKDLLLHILVKTQVAVKTRSTGREASENELGVVISQVRKYLSTAFVRAQSLCLLNRLGFLGEGAKAAAGRRNLAKRLEEGRRRDRQAHYLAHIRGRGLSREGQTFVAQ